MLSIPLSALSTNTVCILPLAPRLTMPIFMRLPSAREALMQNLKQTMPCTPFCQQPRPVTSVSPATVSVLPSAMSDPVVSGQRRASGSVSSC